MIVSTRFKVDPGHFFGMAIDGSPAHEQMANLEASGLAELCAESWEEVVPGTAMRADWYFLTDAGMKRLLEAPEEEEETYRVIRDLRWLQDRYNEECSAKLRQEAAIITRRFVDAGWTEHEDRWQGARRGATETVAVLDLNGDPHKWQIFDLCQAKDCLKTLAEAEKAAKETAE